MPAPFARLLVPLDGSPDAERALHPALDLARRSGAPLTVLRQVSSGDEEEVASYLAELTDRYAGVTDVETVMAERESAALAVIEEAGPGTLVCMSTHGRGRSQALLGSVAESVLRELGQPMLMVGPEAPLGSTLGSGRVFACLDGSAEAEASLDEAAAWAELLGEALWLVEVVPPAPPSGAEGGSGPTPVALAELAGRLGLDDHWAQLDDEHPAHALASLDEVFPVALLVMTTHGRTGWRRLGLGSVMAATVARSRVPVLVVPVPHD